MKRISSIGRSTAVIHALEARIVLRNKFKREPSSTEIDEHLMSNSNGRPPQSVVSMAFKAGKEVRQKFVCICDCVVKCGDIPRKWSVRLFNALPMMPIWRPLCKESPEKTQIDMPDAETDTGQTHVLVKI